MYYRGAQAAIVVYDITNADTFTRAKSWVGELHRQARPDIVIALGMLRFLHLSGFHLPRLHVTLLTTKVYFIEDLMCFLSSNISLLHSPQDH